MVARGATPGVVEVAEVAEAGEAGEVLGLGPWVGGPRWPVFPGTATSC